MTQEFGGETYRKETTWNTLAQVEGKHKNESYKHRIIGCGQD
jgi:hypothetical protein